MDLLRTLEVGELVPCPVGEDVVYQGNNEYDPHSPEKDPGKPFDPFAGQDQEEEKKPKVERDVKKGEMQEHGIEGVGRYRRKSEDEVALERTFKEISHVDNREKAGKTAQEGKRVVFNLF